MGGQPNPHGKTVEFSVITKDANILEIALHDPDDAEYFEVEGDYIAQVSRVTDDDSLGGDQPKN